MIEILAGGTEDRASHPVEFVTSSEASLQRFVDLPSRLLVGFQDNDSLDLFPNSLFGIEPVTIRQLPGVELFILVVAPPMETGGRMTGPAGMIATQASVFLLRSLHLPGGGVSTTPLFDVYTGHT